MTQYGMMSSHWTEMPCGEGMGSFVPDTLWNNIKAVVHFPYNKWLLKRYGCDEFLLSRGIEVAEDSGRVFSYDCVRQVLSLDCIFKNIGTWEMKSVCVIGDGYGYFGCLLKRCFPWLEVVSVNLERNIGFDEYFARKCGVDIMFFNTEDLDTFRFDTVIAADLFINIASFGEMNPDVIDSYFDIMKASSAYLYCCNREEKRLPDGVTRFRHYPWGDAEILMDEECGWYKGSGFFNRFDGAFRHRIVKW